MDQHSQLQSYIQSCRKSGLSDELIRNELLRSGWPTDTVDAELRATGSALPATPHHVRNGVLLILSPFIILAGAIVLQLPFDRAGIHSPIINIVSALAGIAGIIMLPLGPILGIMKLSRP